VKTVNGTQKILIASAGVAVLPLVKLTTYSDKGADPKVVDTIYYFSDRSLNDYDYGNVGTPQSFHPWLRSLPNFSSSGPHMPGSGVAGVAEKLFDVVLHNVPYLESRVATILEAHVLEGALIEISELFVPEKTQAPMDLSSFYGDEHTFQVRGVVNRALINDATVTLQCSTELFDFDWRIVLSSTSFKQDFGTRLPVPYGDTFLRCPSWDVGWRTNTSTPIASATTTDTVTVVDGDGFPASAQFDAKIGTEVLRLSRSEGNVFNIITRARLSSTASLHPAGMPISELVTETTHIVSLYPIATLYGIYVRNPFDNQLLQVQTSFSYDGNDTTTISGETIATVQFSQQELLDLLEYFSQQQNVAAPSEPPAPVTHSPISGSTIDGDARDGDENTKWDLDNTPGDPREYSYTANFNSLPADTVSVTVRIKTGDLGDLVWIRIRRQSNGETKWTAQGGSGWREFEAGPDDEDWYVEWRFEQGTKSFDFYEFERIVYREDPPATTTTPSEIQAATFAADLEVYASVGGVKAPSPVFTDGYGFNDSGTWEELDCTENRETTEVFEGAASREVIIPAAESAPSEIVDCDSLTNWNSSGPTLVIGVDFLGTEQYLRTSTTIEDAQNIWYYLSSLNQNLTDTGSGIGIVLIDFFMERSSWESDSQYPVKFYLGSGTGVTNDVYVWTYYPSEDNFPHLKWVTVALDYRSAHSTIGSPSATDIDVIGVTVTGQSSTLWARCKMNNIRVVRVDASGGSTITSVIQNNAIDGAPVDLSSVSDEYKIYVHLPEIMNTSQLDMQVDISQSTGSGTTQPASRREIYFDGSSASEDSWTELDSYDVIDISSPDESDVRTIRVALTVDAISDGIYSIAHTFSADITVANALVHETIIYVDILNIAGTPDQTYVAIPGDMLELSVDVARHWIGEVGGKTIDETSWGVSHTNLGVNKISGDARSWGITWLDVVNYIGYLSRSNFTHEETSTQTVWKMLQALSTYDFPASSRTLTLFESGNVQQGGREDNPNRDLASSRIFRYDFRPYLGASEEAFFGMIRIGSDQNDASTKVSTATIDAAVAAIGEKPAVHAFFKGIADQTTMIEVAGYYYTEGARIAAKVYMIRDLSWSDGYDLEFGDIVEFVRPWVAGTVKLRVIEVVKDYERQKLVVQGVSL
jgi:hypothetical protein